MELYKSLNSFSQSARNILADKFNSGPGKNRYASTQHVLNELKPLLSKMGLAIHIFPKNTTLISPGEGKISVTVLVTHESGENISFEAEMPLNVGSRQSAADKHMICLTLLTRKIWLGLAGVVETSEADKAETIMNHYGEDPSEDYMLVSATDYLSNAVQEMNGAATIQEMVEIYRRYETVLNEEQIGQLKIIAGQLKTAMEND